MEPGLRAAFPISQGEALWPPPGGSPESQVGRNPCQCSHLQAEVPPSSVMSPPAKPVALWWSTPVAATTAPRGGLVLPVQGENPSFHMC